MKALLACLCLMLACYSAWITSKWWPGSPEFTDLVGQKSTPDGLVLASYVIQNHGPMTGTTYGLTLSNREENPLKSEPILVESEDDRGIDYKWTSSHELEVRLPCGWWGRLTNNHQLTKPDRIVHISYLPPIECSQIHSRSSVVPN